MSASKENSLDIASVDGRLARLRDGSTVALEAMNRQNLLRAAKVRFPDYDGRAWWGISTEVALRAVTDGTVPDEVVSWVRPGSPGRARSTVTPNLGAPSPRSVKFLTDLLTEAGLPVVIPDTQSDVSAEITRLTEEKKKQAGVKAPEPAPVAAPSAIAETPAHSGAVEAAIQALIAASTPATAPIDEDAVRSIVAEAVTAEKIRPAIVQIKRDDRPTVTVNGHTHKVFPKVLAYAARGYHVLMVGPAGSGKSTIAQQVYTALGHEGEIPGMSYGPTTGTHKVLGYNDANGAFVPTPFYDAFAVRGCPFLGDELDNGHEGLVAEQNQALSNKSAAFANGNASMVPGFVFLGTANTYGRGGDRTFSGRNSLDAATLDRFKKVHVDYDEELETAVALSQVSEDDIPAAVRFIETVRRHRSNAADHNLNVVISPRSTIDGVDCVFNLGMSVDEVLDECYLGGLDDEKRRKITAGK